MSKKKSFSRSTMKLRDFHGGTIPTDLVLPSAPGMAVDRGSHDRQSGAWINHGNRGYGERSGFLRQGTGNGPRAFEDKALYFPNAASIGRNYDEDERKPVDSYTSGGESFEDHIYEVRRADYEKPTERYIAENRSKYVHSSTYLNSRRNKFIHDELPLRPTGPPASMYQNSQGISHAVPVSRRQDTLSSHSSSYEQSSGFHATHRISFGVNDSSLRRHQSLLSPPRVERQANRTVSEKALPAATLGPSNVWVTRMEGDSSRGTILRPYSNGIPSSLRAHTIASRVAESSAVEKVSSGRWNSRLSSVIHGQAQSFPGKPSQSQGEPIDGRCITPSMPGLSQMACSSNSNFDKWRSSTDATKETSVHKAKVNHQTNEYGDSRRAPEISGKANYTNRGFGEQCEDARQKTTLPTVNDRHESGITFLESARDKYAGTNHGRYFEEGRYGVTEFGQVSNAGYVDRLRITSNERNTLLEPAQVTQNNPGIIGTDHYDYIVSSNYVNSNDYDRRYHGDSSSSYSDLERGNFSVKVSLSAAVNSERGCYPQQGDASLLQDFGRRSNSDAKANFDGGNGRYSQNHNANLISPDVCMGSTEHRTDIDGKHYGYKHLGDGHSFTDGSRKEIVEGGHSFFRHDRKHESPDYGTVYSHSSESLRSSDFMDAGKAYNSQRSQSPFGKEYDQGLFADGETLPAARDIESSVRKEGAKVNYAPQTSMGLQCKDLPSESFNSRLPPPPRSKLGVNNTLENRSVQGETQMQQSIEGGQSAEILLLDLSAKDEARSRPTTQESSTGSRLLEDQAKTYPTGRRKLILKPRSQPLDTSSDFGSARERQTLFGGARPRELVLKERGVPDSVIAGIEVTPAAGRLVEIIIFLILVVMGCKTYDILYSFFLVPAMLIDPLWLSLHVFHFNACPTHGENRTNDDRDDYRGQQTERLTKVGDEKRDTWHSERLSADSSKYMDSTKFELLDNGGRNNRGIGQGKEGRGQFDKLRGRERRDLKRPDLSMQDSWRLSSETLNRTVGPPSLSPQSGRIITSPGTVGRFSYGHGSSAIELAHTFSPSISSSSGIVSNQRSPGHSLRMNYRAPMSYGASSKEPLFSRLAETLSGP